jgi:hypothetical protein
MEKRDYEQNKVINAQRRENDKLARQLSTFEKEVEDVTAASQEYDKRFADLSGQTSKVKSEVKTRLVKHSEIEALIKEINDMKKSPGADHETVIQLQRSLNELKKHNVSEEKFQELQRQVEEAQKRGGSPEQVQQLMASIEQIKKTTVSTEQLSSIYQTMDDIRKSNVSREQFTNALQQIKDLENKTGLSKEEYQNLLQKVSAAEKSGNLADRSLAELQAALKKVDAMSSRAEGATHDADEILNRVQRKEAEFEEVYDKLKGLLDGNKISMEKMFKDDRLLGQMKALMELMGVNGPDIGPLLSKIEQSYGRDHSSFLKALLTAGEKAKQAETINAKQQDEIDELQNNLSLTTAKAVNPTLDPNKQTQLKLTPLLKRIQRTDPEKLDAYIQQPKGKQATTKIIRDFLKPHINNAALQVSNFFDNKFDPEKMTNTEMYEKLRRININALLAGRDIKGSSKEFLKAYDEYLIDEYLPRILSQAGIVDVRQVKKLSRGIMTNIENSPQYAEYFSDYDYQTQPDLQQQSQPDLKQQSQPQTQQNEPERDEELEKAQDLYNRYKGAVQLPSAYFGVDENGRVFRKPQNGELNEAVSLRSKVPESTKQEINALAENILGPQYAKYLK